VFALPRRTQIQLVRISADHMCHNGVEIHFGTVGLRRVPFQMREKSLICLVFSHCSLISDIDRNAPVGQFSTSRKRFE